MNAIATDAVLDDAIAVLSEQASEFLCAAHAGLVKDAHATADAYMHRLREFARMTGAPLDEMPSYNANITNWRAIARLAGSVVETNIQAG
jgi:hypothetical protein